MTSMDRFVDFARAECRAEGVKVVLTEGRIVRTDHFECAGFFYANKDERVLKVATGRPGWQEIFVHEFGHFLQWRGGSELWRRSAKSRFSEWIAGDIELTPAKALEHCRLDRDLELDCERRSMRLIRRYELPLDQAGYARRANCYIFSHQLMYEHRHWFNPGLHSLPEFPPLVPAELLSNHAYDTPSEAFREKAVARIRSKDAA